MVSKGGSLRISAVAEARSGWVYQAINRERPFFGVDGRFAVRGGQVKIIVGRDGAKRGLRTVLQVFADASMLCYVGALHQV